MNFKLCFLSPFVLLFSTQNFGYICRIEALEKNGQRVYLMYDLHEERNISSVNKVVPRQLKDLEIINKYKGYTIFEGTMEFFEDEYMNSPDFISKFYYQYFKNIDPNKKTNIELRKKAILYSDNLIKTKDIINDLELIKQQIDGYNDGATLNNLYKQISEKIETKISFLHNVYNCNRTQTGKILAFLSQLSPDIYNFDQIKKELMNCLYYAPHCVYDFIIEAKAIHTIYNNPKEENIFVITGAEHNVVIKDILKKLVGFKEIKSVGNQWIGKDDPNFDKEIGNPNREKMLETYGPVDIKAFFNELEQETLQKPILTKL